jgi:enoyl-CoA hydratase
VQLTKRAVNRSYDAMGLRGGLAQGLDHAIMTELTETAESREFSRILNEDGAKAALAWCRARLEP